MFYDWPSTTFNLAHRMSRAMTPSPKFTINEATDEHDALSFNNRKRIGRYASVKRADT